MKIPFFRSRANWTKRAESIHEVEQKREYEQRQHEMKLGINRILGRGYESQFIDEPEDASGFMVWHDIHGYQWTHLAMDVFTLVRYDKSGDRVAMHFTNMAELGKAKAWIDAKIAARHQEQE